MNPITVAKFGGTSVADYDCMVRCAEIVLNNQEIRLVVVSASAGVTNYLVDLASKELNKEERQKLLNDIKEIEFSILEKLGNPEEVKTALNQLLEKLAEISFDPQLKENKAKQDKLLSYGERMSSLLFAELLRQRNAHAVNFDVRQVLKTDSNFTKAEPQIELIERKALQLIKPELQSSVFVTQGFIGSDENNQTTTLGRGGSDYSAALLAEALSAKSLEIWTDVIGIYTTDPRLTDEARPIPEISFDEAAEMATFGAKILHPATLIPAIRKNIRVFVGSSRKPEQGGTWVLNQVEQKPAYRAIALRKDQVLVTVKSPQMLHATGFLAQVFSILAKHKMSIDLITTSEISVALTIDNPTNSATSSLTQEAIDELSEFCEVSVEDNLSLVAVIGNHLQGVGSELFNALETISPRMICQGASPNNICFLIPQQRAKETVRDLHSQLFA